MKPHSNPYIQAWLRECGPASAKDYNRAHGLAGKAAALVGQRMAGMRKDGILDRAGRGGCGHPYVYSVARDPITVAQKAELLTAARRRHAAERRAARPAPAPKVPKPPKPAATRRLRIVTDAVPAPAAMKLAPVDRSQFPDTEAFIRANPHLVERLPMDAPWNGVRETLTASQRRLLTGRAVA